MQFSWAVGCNLYTNTLFSVIQRESLTGGKNVYLSDFYFSWPAHIHAVSVGWNLTLDFSLDLRDTDGGASWLSTFSNSQQYSCLLPPGKPCPLQDLSITTDKTMVTATPNAKNLLHL